jgi:ATP synthase in type III secretion protein N
MGIGESINILKYLDALEPVSPVKVRGRVTEIVGLVLKGAVPGVRMGEVVEIWSHHKSKPLLAEVVGFKDEQALLMPFGPAEGVGLDSEVRPTGKPFTIRVGEPMRGWVLNGLGEPLMAPDGLALGDWQKLDLAEWAVDRFPPDPTTRKRVTEAMPMGIRAIDGLLLVGEGQRVGLFAGSGVGKSTLMGQITRNCSAEMCVVCLVGERGREVLDFVQVELGPEGLARSVVVCATSDRPSLEKLKACFVATAIAEWFRDRGVKVLFMMDSTTRLARAQREVGLACGEPPARQGYPPSVFAMLPTVLERTGNNHISSITALYTVLVAGGDMEEPIADEVRGILDGHIILNRALGARNHWPAIDVPVSLSRVMNSIASKAHKKAAGKLREVLSTYEKNRDLIMLGAYEYGTDPNVDFSIDKIEEVNAYLKQGLHEKPVFEESVQRLIDMFPE